MSEKIGAPEVNSPGEDADQQQEKLRENYPGLTQDEIDETIKMNAALNAMGSPEEVSEASETTEMKDMLKQTGEEIEAGKKERENRFEQIVKMQMAAKYLKEFLDSGIISSDAKAEDLSDYLLDRAEELRKENLKEE